MQRRNVTYQTSGAAASHMFTRGRANIFEKRSSLVKNGVGCLSLGQDITSSPKGFRTKQDGVRSCFDQNYGNRLLGLRAQLNEKELQLVELREQHINVINRAAIARKNWEEAVKSKDHVIMQLQKALHAKKCELDRQERVNEENVQRLLSKGEKQESTELDHNKHKISLLEQRNAQFVKEVVEQQKMVTMLKSQLKDGEECRASHLHKIEVINGRVQDLKAALQKKEEILETREKSCQQMKGMVWKRDAIIGHLQLAEQQLQSALARQQAECESLECLRIKLQEEKINAHKGLEEKEAILRKQRQQIHELQKTLQSKELVIMRKIKDQQKLSKENKRLVDKYNSLKQDFDHAERKQQALKIDLEAVQDRLSTAEIVIAEAEQSGIGINVEYLNRSSIEAPDAGPDDLERQSMECIESTAINKASGVGTCQRQSMPLSMMGPVRSCGTSYRLAAEKCFSWTRGEEQRGSKLQLKNPAHDGNYHQILGQMSQWPLRNSNKSTTVDVTRDSYRSATQTENKAERKASTDTNTVDTQSYTSGSNVGIKERYAAISEAILSLPECSEKASPSANVGCLGAEQNTTEHIGHIGQKIIGPKSVRTKNPIFLHSCRELSPSHVRSSPPSREDPRAQSSPTVQTNSLSIRVNNLKRGNPRQVGRLLTPPSSEQSEISESAPVEFERSCYLSTSLTACHREDGRTDISSRSGYSGRPFYIPRTSPPTGSRYQTVWTSRERESLGKTSPAHAYVDSQSSPDTALKHLQEEVMKRERGWRRTEASMRAALCQRVAELNKKEELDLEDLEGKLRVRGRL